MRLPGRRDFLLAAGALLASPLASAQRAAGRAFQVGVILHGGPFRAAVAGLRQALGASGEEGKQWALEVRETKGDLSAVERAAQELQRRPADLLYTLAGSVTQRVAQATRDVPIVFAVGSDPVTLKLVHSLRRPGTRLTGIHFLQTDLTPKRLQILKLMLPNARRVVTCYDPGNKGAVEAAGLAREAAGKFGLRLVERHVRSVDELRQAIRGLRPGELDAYFFTSDAMVASEAQFIIDTARAIRLPTMFHEESLVHDGALASYGLSYREIGRLSATFVARIMEGARPHELPVERADRVELAINARTAKAIGVALPPSLLMQADEVIE